MPGPRLHQRKLNPDGLACDCPLAVFENPLATAKGKERIADLFCLTGLLGGVWSELGDIAESQAYGQSAATFAYLSRRLGPAGD